MHHALELSCDRDGCDRSLSEESFRLSYRTAGTERRVYECSCGGITITIGRFGESA